MAAPWEKYGGQPAPTSPPARIMGTPKPVAAPTPLQLRGEARSDAGAAREEIKFEERNNPTLKTGYRWKDGIVGGEAELIPGITDNESKPTEYQSKSAGFLGRMLQAEDLYSAVPEGARDARTLPGQALHDYFPGIDSTFNSSDRNKSDQAARNFIAASLRQESGAAISENEYRNQYKIFFPQPGDGPEEIAQKALARKQAIEGFKIAAGPLAGDVQTVGSATGEAEQGSAMSPVGIVPPGDSVDRSAPLPLGPNPGGVGPTELKAGPVESYVTDTDKRVAARTAALANGGASISQINEYLASQNIPPLEDWKVSAINRARSKGEKVTFTPYGTGKQTGVEKVISSVADSPLGAYAIHAANTITAGGLDEIAGAVGGEGAGERAQFAKEYTQQNSPGASFLGDIAGGLTVAPLLPASAASIPGGIIAGGTYGALENNDNRLLGALIGAGTGGAVNKYAPSVINAASSVAQPLIEAGNKSLSKIGSMLPGGAARAAQKAEVQASAPVIQAAADEGLSANLRQADIQPSLRDQYGGVEASKLGGPKIQAAASEDAAAIAARLAEIGGNGTPRDGYGLGSGVQKAVAGEKDAISKEAGALYTRAELQAPGFKAPADNIAADIDGRIAEITRKTPEGNEAQIGLLNKIKGNFEKTGISTETLQANRGIVSRHVKDNNLAFTPEEVELIDAIGVAGKELETALADSGNQAALSSLKAANAKWTEYSDFKKAIVKDIIGTKNSPVPPETAARRLLSMVKAGGDSDKFSRVYKLLPDEEKLDFKALLIEQIGADTNGNFSLGALARNLASNSGDEGKKYSYRSLRDVLGPEDFKSLMNLKLIASAKNGAMKGKNFSNTARAANNGPDGFGPVVKAGLGYASAGTPGAIAATIAPGIIERVGTRKAVKMLLNNDFRRWVDRLPNTTDPRVIDKYLKRLDQIKAPEVASNVIAIKDWLANGMAQSPGKLAAQEEDK